MRPEPNQVLHFSEDPTITLFVPHVAATARQQTPYVWAVDATRSPDYWFPRDCPRTLAWPIPTTTSADLLSPGSSRLHAIEYGWLDTLRTTRLYAYRLPAATFTPFADDAPTPTWPPPP